MRTGMMRSDDRDRSIQLFSRSKREEVMQRLKWQVEGDSDPESSEKEEPQEEIIDPGRI